MTAFNLFAAPAIAACAIVPAPTVPRAWPQAARDFGSPAEIGDVALRFPNSAGMQRRRLSAAIASGDAAEGLSAMRRLASMGAALSPADQARARPLVGAAASAQLAACFSANAQPAARSRLYAHLPAEQRLVEGLLWDPERRRLFATSVVGGRIVPVGGEGAPSEPLGSLLGGAYDSASRRFLIATAPLGFAPAGQQPFAGLLSVDPDDLGDVTRIRAPAGATPGDVAVAADGTVFASDGLSGAVYRCRAGCTTLELWLPAGTFFSAQGLAVSADQRLLYVADRRYGLAAVELATGRVLRVEGGPGVMLDGMDGLLLHGGDLIATQTAYAPQRIVRLRIARDGLSVMRVDLLERAHPEWGELGLAAIDGNRLIYVADAQWARWGAGGVPTGEAPAAPTPIRSLMLG